MHQTCHCVLSQKNPDDSDVCRARPLGPSDIVDIGTVGESSEHGLAALVLRGREDINGEGGHAERMLPHRYLKMHTPMVLIVPPSGLFWVSRD
jgi:hypothetical protein